MRRNIFMRRAPSGADMNASSPPDENASVASDMTYQSESGWATMLGLGRAGDTTLDDMLKNLYQDPDILEERCKDELSKGSATRRTSIGGTEYVTSRRGSLLSAAPTESVKAEKEAWQRALEAGATYTGVKASKTPEQVISNLHEGYFDGGFDPVERQLQVISDWEEEGMLDRFMATIEETDTDKDVILSQLAEMISVNYSELMSCMRDVHAIDMDLARTAIQLKNSRRKLESGKKLIVTGTLDITRLQTYKENLTLVHVLAEKLQGVRSLFQNMQGSIQIGDVGEAAESSYRILLTLQDEAFYCLKGLESYSVTVQRLLPTLRQKTDKALLRLVSRKFASAEYAGIMRSYLTLDHMQENMGVHIISGGTHDKEYDDEVHVYDDEPCMEGLARRVLRYQIADIGSCMRSTVMELIYASAKAHGANSQHTVLDLTELSQDELYQRITPDITVPCVVRACELLVDVVHTNYLITQWHRTPFDERTKDMTFLHRCPIEHGDMAFSDEDSEEGEEEDGEVAGSRQRGNSSADRRGGGRKTHDSDAFRDSIIRTNVVDDMSSMLCGGLREDGEADSPEDMTLSPEEVRSQRLQAARLTDATHSLMACRPILWEEVERAIVDLFHAISPSAEIALEDFAALLWALDAVIRLGREFCCTESRALQHCVAVKSVEYASSIHLSSVSQLQKMLEAEPWRSVPIHLNEVGGILGLIKMYVLKQPASAGGPTGIRIRGMVAEAMAVVERRSVQQAASRSQLAAKYTQQQSPTASPGPANTTGDGSEGGIGEGPGNLDEAVSMLMEFFPKGNPLHFMTAGQEEEEVAEGGGATTLSSPLQGDTYQVGSHNGGNTAEVNLMMEALSKLFEEDHSLPLSRRAQQQSSAMVVTQTSLNGLAKFTGRYMHMMQLMPTAAPAIFSGICQLFDLYLYTVFVGFVSAEERQKIFTKALPRSIAPPPLQAKEFEALQQRMIYLFSASSGQRTSASWSAADSVQFTNVFNDPDLLRCLNAAPAVVQGGPDSFFALNERVVAAESCWFAAKMLGEVKTKLLQLLPEAHKQTSSNNISDFDLIAGQLRSLVYRAMCPNLVKQQEILQILVEQSGWELKQMREEPHEWVDVLTDNCIDVWEYMEEGDEFAEASTLVREQVWLELCQCAFDTVLEGLSRVRKCSTEGRASMTMDVSALHTGLDHRHVCRPPRGRGYVDMYIKALYLTEDETVRWALSQCQTYAHRHLVGLLKQALSSMMSNRKLSQSLAALDAEYDELENEENKLTSMLSHRFG